MRSVGKQKQSPRQRNANSYSELAGRRQATSNDIEWAMHLRTTTKNYAVPHRAGSSLEPPQVYFKPTESAKKKHTTSDVQGWSDPSGLVHLIMHRAGQPPASVVRFQGSLRSGSTITKTLEERERSWWSLPKIDRKEEASFLKQESLKKTKELREGDFETAYEGYLNYPRYNQRPVERNINRIRHLLRVDFTLPTLEWQASLRSSEKSSAKGERIIRKT